MLPLPSLDHEDPAAIVIEPFKSIEVMSAQRSSSDPALTVGAGVNVITTWSVSAAQIPLPVVSAINVTFPSESSCDVGVYIVVKPVLDENEPAPDVDHLISAACETVALKFITELFSQIKRSEPALTTG